MIYPSLCRALHTEERLELLSNAEAPRSTAKERSHRARERLTWWSQQLKRSGESMTAWREQEFGASSRQFLDVIGLSDTEISSLLRQKPQWMACLESILELARLSHP